MRPTAHASKSSPKGFGWAGARVSAGHGDAQVEEGLVYVLGAAPVASHEVAEPMSMRRVVQDSEELERWLLRPNTQTNPLADRKATIGIRHQLQPDLLQAIVHLGDGGAGPLHGPAHPCCDRRRRGRVTQPHDEGAAVASVVGKRARRRVVHTRGRADQGDEALAHGVAAGRSAASGSAAGLFEADVSLAQDFVRVHGVDDYSEGGSNSWAGRRSDGTSGSRWADNRRSASPGAVSAKGCQRVHPSAGEVRLWALGAAWSGSGPTPA
jgi:hypothetical protein